MSIHWTYETFSPEGDLLQGDVLEPTDAFRNVLQQVHPHFLDSKYTAFLLTTQSCDLVARKGRYSTKYLNIAVVRPLEAVLHDLLSAVCRTVAGGVYIQETKSEARRLLERLFNQNEQSLGLFYLHPDGAAGINIPSVALLRVTVSLRVEHYDVLRMARRGRLCSEFRGKLGWLVGNLYSRIGTQDWSDPPERAKDLDKLVKQCLDAEEALYGPVWVPEKSVAAAEEQGVELDQLARDQVLAALEAHKPPPTKTLVIAQVLRVLNEVVPTIGSETLKRIENRLGNDQVFARAVRHAKSE